MENDNFYYAKKRYEAIIRFIYCATDLDRLNLFMGHNDPKGNMFCIGAHLTHIERELAHRTGKRSVDFAGYRFHERDEKETLETNALGIIRKMRAYSKEMEEALPDDRITQDVRNAFVDLHNWITTMHSQIDRLLSDCKNFIPAEGGQILLF
jgi:hypothetical protein